MTQTFLVSSSERLNHEICSALKEEEIEVTAMHNEDTEIFAVRHGKAVSKEKATCVQRCLYPLSLDVLEDASLPANEIRVCLAKDPDMQALRISIYGENRAQRDELRDELTADGCRRPRTYAEFAAADTIEYGAASPRQLDRLAFWLRRRGRHPVRKRVFAKDDRRVRICLSDPLHRDRPPGGRVVVQVRTDCAQSGRSVARRLKKGGFPRTRVAIREPEAALSESAVIGVDPGSLGAMDASLEVAELIALTGEEARAAGGRPPPLSRPDDLGRRQVPDPLPALRGLPAGPSAALRQRRPRPLSGHHLPGQPGRRQRAAQAPPGRGLHAGRLPQHRRRNPRVRDSLRCPGRRARGVRAASRAGRALHERRRRRRRQLGAAGQAR